MTKSNRRLVWFNGEFIPESEAKISIYDSALMFGDMVFEMTRSFNKKQFKLKKHLERLYASLKYVNISIEMSIDEIIEHIYETIEINDPLFAPDDEHRIMINVSRGLLSIYQDIVDVYKGANIIIADFPLRWTVRGMGELFNSGINAIIPSQRAIPASLLESKVKNRSRLHYLMANIEVSNYIGKNNWALLLDPEGFIAEGPGYNFFIIKDKQLITPEPRNILRGISRAYVFELAKELNLICIEKNIEPYDVFEAEESFITGTPFCILPVTSLNGKSIGNRKRGIVTAQLLNTWSQKVGVDIEGQIKHWDSKRERNEKRGISPYSFKKL